LITQSFFPLPSDIDRYDAIIFTSTNSVKAFEHYHDILKIKQIYPIGEATNSALIRLGIPTIQVGENLTGNAFATAVAPLLQGLKTLFPHAQKMVSKAKEIFSDAGLDITYHIAYETVCHKSDEVIDEGSVIIFSSPSTIECFFKNYTWDESYKAVVIGETTASYMPQEIGYELSDHHTLEACVVRAKELLT
jgi:uroporphyrinogen-III synthase